MNADFEEKVKRLNRHIPAVDHRVYDWALDEAMPHIAVLREGNVAQCLKCRCKMDLNEESAYVRCAKCGLRLKVVDSTSLRKMRIGYDFTFKVECLMADVRVIRTFRMAITLNLNNGLETYSVKELCRHWIASNGKEAYMGTTLWMGRFVFPDVLRIRHRNVELYQYYENTAVAYAGGDERVYCHTPVEDDFKLKGHVFVTH